MTPIIIRSLSTLALGIALLGSGAAMAQQAGYNQGNGSTTEIGSNRQTGGATNADRSAMQNIQESIQRQRQMSQRP